MTDKPPVPEDDKLPEVEADARFQRLVGNLVNTPHQPHQTKTPPGEPRGGKGSAPEEG